MYCNKPTVFTADGLAATFPGPENGGDALLYSHSVRCQSEARLLPCLLGRYRGMYRHCPIDAQLLVFEAGFSRIFARQTNAFRTYVSRLFRQGNSYDAVVEGDGGTQLNWRGESRSVWIISHVRHLQVLVCDC